MSHEQSIILQFTWEHPEFVTVQPSLGVNLWGDILYRGVLVAESDLHGLPIDELGTKLPESWTVVKSIRDAFQES